MYSIDQFLALLFAQLKISRVTRKKRVIIEKDRLPPHLVYIWLDVRTCFATIREKRLQENRMDQPIRPSEIRYFLNDVERLLNLRLTEALKEKDQHDEFGQMHFEQVERALSVWRPNFVYVCENENLAYRRKIHSDIPTP